MANEAVCIETPTKFARYTITNTQAIPLHTLLCLSGADLIAMPSTDAASETFAGIAWEEKTAGDGLTQIVAALDGVWDIKDSGSGITLGGIVSLSGVNMVKQAVEAEMVTGDIIGKALETAGASEVIRVRVGGII